jgi:hypothetical protein
MKLSKKQKKRLIEIYRKVRETVRCSREPYLVGLCHAVSGLEEYGEITWAEYQLFYAHFQQYAPDSTWSGSSRGWWWTPGDKQVRMDFCDERIKELGG